MPMMPPAPPELSDDHLLPSALPIARLGSRERIGRPAGGGRHDTTTGLDGSLRRAPSSPARSPSSAAAARSTIIAKSAHHLSLPSQPVEALMVTAPLIRGVGGDDSGLRALGFPSVR